MAKKDIHNPAAMLGRKGGNATFKKYGIEHMSEMGKKGAAQRKKNRAAKESGQDES